MWPRDLELALGLWLAVSPFVFGHGADEHALWAQDFAGAFLLVLLAVLSYSKRTYWAHWLELPVAAWLVGSGWWSTRGEEVAAASQNHLLVGLLVAMLAIIPNRSFQPPPGWRASPDRPSE